jgi:hypothetical protein
MDLHWFLLFNLLILFPAKQKHGKISATRRQDFV